MGRLDQRDLLELVKRHVDISPGVSVGDVCGRGRTKTVAATRRAIWIDMRDMGLSLTEIGRLFGRHHTSILQGVNEARREKAKATAAKTYRARLARARKGVR